MIDKTILQQLESSFSDNIPDLKEAFEIMRLDSELFVFKCKESELKLAINWKHLSERSRQQADEYGEMMEYIYKSDLSIDNRGFLMLDSCGFHFKQYGEFLLSYQNSYYNMPKIDELTLGNIQLEISEPSNIYKLLFNHFTYDDHFVDGWGKFYTLKLKGCNKDLLERTLQQALFLIAKYDPPEIIGDYPQIIPFEFEGDIFIESETIDEPDSYEFDLAKHTEPLAFYNAGRKNDDPLYYYRVLEYFFIINKKTEILKLIETYNKANNLDSFVDSITRLYGTREEVLLENLLIKINGIESIVDESFNAGIIESSDIPTFSRKLYGYRNSIVHGKGDIRLELSVPKILDPLPHSHKWKSILRTLAEKVIDQFC